METKKCKKCGVEHSIEHYDWADKLRGYLKSYCRGCSMKTYNKWKVDNFEKHKEWFEQYYKNNPLMFGRTGLAKGRPMKTTQKSGVYLITNTETGETYVGCSSDIKRRIWRHFYNRGRAKIKPLSKAIKQYGLEAFTSEVLEYCDKEVIFEKETEWMMLYGCEYNTKKK